MFGSRPVSEIDTELIMRVLEPLWYAKTETASRLRGRIESVLDWARVRGYRTGENPARWRGHLNQLLPKRADVQRVVHHAAMPYSEIADFMSRLATNEGTAARALEFTILTAARTAEVIGMIWDEVDLATGTWIVPAERMKTKREHRIPLSTQALRVLRHQQANRTGEFVFPGQRYGKSISNRAMLNLLKRATDTDLTVHGFRSTFRDWAAEASSFPREVAEAELAHVLTNKSEAAYQRGDLFEKRRKMMEAWADYLEKPQTRSNIVPLQSAG